MNRRFGVVLAALMVALDASAADIHTNDLAGRESGVMVYVSSFANTTDLYSENLIDGDPGAVWQAFDVSMPQWIELRWPQAVRLEKLAPIAASPTTLKSWKTERWENGAWLPLGGSSVEVTRVRITITEASGLPLRLSGIEARGERNPSIDSLRPYWSASYIWHGEPGHTIQVGKPRFFRVSFPISDLKSVTSAFLQSRANDFYAAYINGKKVASGNVDIKAEPVRDRLREGENVLAYEAEARSNPGWGLMELLGELTINTSGRAITVASGRDWKSSDTRSDGWNTPGFDDSGWKPVAVLLKPPQGPWGRIPFHDVAEGEAVRVVETAISPSPARPGSEVEVRLRLQPDTKLRANYLIELRAGEIEVNRDRSDYVVARETITPDPPLSDWTEGEPRWLGFKLQLPPWSPEGSIPIQLSAAALDGSGKSLRFEVQSPPVLTVERAPTQALKHSGTQPPLFWALQSPSYERFNAYANAGPRVFHLQMYPYRVEPDTDYSKPHLAFLDQHIRNLLRVVPDARVIVEMDLRASGAWKRAHPEALLVDAFGNARAESVASKEYQDAVVAFLQRTLSFLNAQPWADRIVGFIPEFGPLAESCLGGVESNEGVVDRSQWTVGDWNPQAMAMFREFLRQKYGGDTAKLRAAWKDEQVEFETATPDRARLVEAAPDHNLFRDPRAGRMRADYFEFLSSIVPTVFEQKVARTIKDATRDKALVGSYFGYVVENLRGINPPACTQQNNHFGFMRVIDSPHIDFFVSPLHYDYSRRAGGRFFPFQPYASIGLHKKLYVAEMDYRTFICGDPTYGRQHSQEETVAVLQRDLASTFIGGSGAWFADWSSGTGRKSHGFFLDDQILATIGRAYRIHQGSEPSRDREGADSDNPQSGIRSLTVAARPDSGARPKKTTQIAVVVSSKSPWHQDCAYPAIIYNSLICSVLYQEMAALGAPFDVLLIDDLGRKEVRNQYKLFVFINPFYLTRDERKWIESLKGGGRTLLWFYAPGYVSDEHGLSVDQVARATGMDVKLLAERSTPMFLAKDDGTVVTIEPFGSALNFSTIMPTEIYPNFHVEDSAATALGVDDEGRVRFAEKHFGAWRSIYSAVPNLPRTILRRIAETAGVHLYAPLDIIVDANDRYLMLHNGNKLPREVHVSLPRPATVVDLYSGETRARSVTHFELVLPKTTTRVFQLEAR